ncbi:MAG TPA: Ig-like domain-containing protein [Trebonia sp.]|nr:Ig-like domain-containing protein [Trebonia sp.]
MSLAGVVTLAAAPAARADATVSLPDLSGFRQMIVDNADGYLFLSEGPFASSTGVVVTALDGSYVTTLDEGDEVAGIALDGGTLYAALDAQDAIGVTDAATLDQGQSYPLPGGDVPSALAVASGTVWVSYSGGIGGLDPATGTFTPLADPWPGTPDLAADPAGGGVLAAILPATSPATAATYDTTASPAAVLAPQAPLAGTCTNESQVAVVPGGAEFLAACGSPHAVSAFPAASADAPAASYPASGSLPGYPVAVAVAGDGAVAVGTTGPSSDVEVYAADGTGRNVYSLGGSAELAVKGLAWSADGSKLYAVTAPGGSARYSLHVFDSPQVTQTSLTLSGPASAVDSGTTVTLAGQLSDTLPAAPAGAPVTITRSAANQVTATLPATTTDASGHYAVTDTPVAAGTYTYTATYAGTNSIAPATATTTVVVSLAPATIRLAAPATALPLKSLSVTGTLSFAVGTPPAKTAITVTRKNPNGTSTRLPTATTGANGAFTVTDDLSALGAYSYTAAYAGSPGTTAASATAALTVARAAAPLTLAAGASTALYDATLTVTAHLGATYSNRAVSVYAQLVGDGTNRLLRTAAVNSAGNLVLSYPAATRSVIFTATFTGDSQYLARSVAVRIGVGARVAMTNSGWYATTTISGATYRVFHQAAHLNTAITVTPNKHGEHVQLDVQEWYGNTWYQDPKNVFTYTLTSSSQLSTYLTLANAAGARYRVRAVFVPAASDVTNVSYYSPWFYFQVNT